jgi:multiple antibiotic resistance protein
VLVVLWLTLRLAGLVRRLLGEPGIELVTRISGLLLTAIAVQLVADAVREFISGRRLRVLRLRTPPFGWS